jgi:hypothetical protein
MFTKTGAWTASDAWLTDCSSILVEESIKSCVAFPRFLPDGIDSKISSLQLGCDCDMLVSGCNWKSLRSFACVWITIHQWFSFRTWQTVAELLCNPNGATHNNKILPDRWLQRSTRFNLNTFAWCTLLLYKFNLTTFKISVLVHTVHWWLLGFVGLGEPTYLGHINMFPGSIVSQLILCPHYSHLTGCAPWVSCFHSIRDSHSILVEKTSNTWLTVDIHHR